MSTFDRSLSLAIDEAHNELNRLSCKRGVLAWGQRIWWSWKLRRLERDMP